MSLILAIERSVNPGSWALFQNKILLKEDSFKLGGIRAPSWMSEIMDGFAALGISAAELTELVISTGPGSFSGIRASLAAMEGLSLPGETPLYGLSTAALLAYQHSSKAGSATITVMGDARRDRLWLSSYRIDSTGNRLQMSDGTSPSHTGDDYKLVSWDELPGVLETGSVLISPDWQRIATRLAEIAPGNVQLVIEQVRPRASALGKLYLSKASNPRLNPLPIYLYPPVGE